MFGLCVFLVELGLVCIGIEYCIMFFGYLIDDYVVSLGVFCEFFVKFIFEMFFGDLVCVVVVLCEEVFIFFGCYWIVMGSDV